jgi:hypothetical protein
MDEEKHIFEVYKPLRNHLRKICIAESLLVIWAYIQHIYFDKPIPSDIQAHRSLLLKKPLEKGIYPWALELLTREIIINSQHGDHCSHTLKRWDYLSRVMNEIRTIENEISKKYITPTNVLVEIHRIAHRQFPWQGNVNLKFLTRYFKIFVHPGLDQIINDTIHLSTQEIYVIGSLFLGNYLDRPFVTYPIEVRVKELDLAKVDKFLSRFSRKSGELKDNIMKEQEFNDKFAYSYSSLRTFPLVRMDYQGKDTILCPLLPLLLWRITNGLYYEICGAEDFGTYFGKSFQSYAGEVIVKSKMNTELDYLPEEQYYDGKNRKDTPDWIVFDKESALFVECKTKRMVYPAKVALSDEEPLRNELETMADFILQVYKTIRDYRDNKYPAFKFDNERHLFPVILTLEDWYLFGGKLLEDLKILVEKKIETSDIPSTYISEMPYSICSIDEFEDIMQIIQITGISQFMGKKAHDTEKSMWAFSSFINNDFPEEKKSIRFLFEEDCNNIFKEYLSRPPSTISRTGD